MDNVIKMQEKQQKVFFPSTQRTQQLRHAYMEQKHSISAERSVLVTDSYRKTEAMPSILRQAMAFEKVLNEVPVWITGRIKISLPSPTH